MSPTLTTINDDTSEMAILSRVLSSGKNLTPALARHILGLCFGEKDVARINELANRNQDGKLSPAEREELRGYANAGCLLGVLHAKARLALKKVAKPNIIPLSEQDGGSNCPARLASPLGVRFPSRSFVMQVQEIAGSETYLD